MRGYKKDVMMEVEMYIRGIRGMIIQIGEWMNDEMCLSAMEGDIEWNGEAVYLMIGEGRGE